MTSRCRNKLRNATFEESGRQEHPRLFLELFSRSVVSLFDSRGKTFLRVGEQRPGSKAARGAQSTVDIPSP